LNAVISGPFLGLRSKITFFINRYAPGLLSIFHEHSTLKRGTIQSIAVHTALIVFFVFMSQLGTQKPSALLLDKSGSTVSFSYNASRTIQTKRLPLQVVKQNKPTEISNEQASRNKALTLKAVDTALVQENAFSSPNLDVMQNVPANNLSAQVNEWSAYCNELSVWLNRLKRYPKSASKQKLTGTAFISFKLEREGDFSEPKISQSSGFAELDQEAYDLILRARKYKRPPEKYANTLVIVPVSFLL